MTLSIYDGLGRKVRDVVNEEQKAGARYEVVFEASGLSSGTYYARLRSGGSVAVRRMLLMKY